MKKYLFFIFLYCSSCTYKTFTKNTNIKGEEYFINNNVAYKKYYNIKDIDINLLDNVYKNFRIKLADSDIEITLTDRIVEQIPNSKLITYVNNNNDGYILLEHYQASITNEIIFFKILNKKKILSQIKKIDSVAFNKLK